MPSKHTGYLAVGVIQGRRPTKKKDMDKGSAEDKESGVLKPTPFLGGKREQKKTKSFATGELKKKGEGGKIYIDGQKMLLLERDRGTNPRF